MRRILLSTAAGALLLIAAAPAASAAPAVSIRIEGASSTLLPQTTVQTTAASKVRGNSCPGSSVAGALDIATAGNWAGSYSTKFGDYLISSILGETPAGNNFWTLWVNGISASTGACQTKLHPFDHVLWFDCVADANFNCTNDPLRVTAPALVRRNAPVTVRVVQLDGFGHSRPFAGAAVTGSGIAGVSSGSGGTARVTPHRTGVIRLQASRSGVVPSDPVFICVYAARRSECASSGVTGPRVHIGGVRNHERFATGPRELRGTAGPAPSGLTDVRLSLHRRAPGGRCSYFDADRAAFRGTACAAHPTPAFSIGSSAAWSYLLPARLPAGSYVLTVTATDGNGRSGHETLSFTVTAPRARHAAALPTVPTMVVGPGGAVIAQRNLKLSAARIAIGRRHCSVPRGTALAALVAGRFDLGVVDLAGCDPTQMFVRRIGTYRNHGAAGWEYKVGHRDPSFGAADPGGRLRSGQRLLWYWCARAGACERTLEVTLRGSRARVIGYDDNGHGRPIAGATVHLDTTTVITGADGTATLTVTPGRHTLYATKRGLVPSFAERFTAA